MKRTGAALAVQALEDVGVQYTFGIPGVHTTEIYDALNSSRTITPILVTHELGAAFMADAISRTTDSIGTLVIVPAAGTTHALSGIGEAFLDGIPMLVISGGVRRDSGRHFQLHQVDQTKIVAALTKAAFVVREHKDVVPTIHEAYRIAVSGTPGPVFVEIPAEIQLFQGEIENLPPFVPGPPPAGPDPALVKRAVELLRAAKKPGLYLGWGARGATRAAIRLAEALEMPVSTTLQGLSVFPHNHALHAGMGFGGCAVPAARKAFDGCDCLLAVGARFGELATGSYSLPVPADLIHVDINSAVFDKNYPSKVAIAADASAALEAIADALGEGASRGRSCDLRSSIRAEKEAYVEEWTRNANPTAVSPGRFFRSLRHRLEDEAFVVLDDGNHTFLAAEQFPVYRSRHIISPTDYNAMGYCVPGAVAVSLAHPDRQVVGVVGDGAFLMTGLELLTGTSLGVSPVLCVFNDGELAQISQFQETPLNRKTCTVLGKADFEGVARATGAAYFPMRNDDEIDGVLDAALEAASREKRPVVVDVRVDYSKKTSFTRGVVKANLGRFPFGEKIRFIGRAIKRHALG